MTHHVPILVDSIVSTLLQSPVLESLKVHQTEAWIVDFTFGGGGHTRALLEALKSQGLLNIKVLGLDQDLTAIEMGKKEFHQEVLEKRLVLEHSRISESKVFLEGKKIVGVLADLGFSSDQIEDPKRGLSFLKEGPLDMRMDLRQTKNAKWFLQHLNEKELADLFYKLGEERLSRRIAKTIKEHQKKEGVIETTTVLAQVIKSAIPFSSRSLRRAKIHPATRVFQALRIAVNQELEELKHLLSCVILEVIPGGRVAILSFHSLEDREVKKTFLKNENLWFPLKRKPEIALEDEVTKNPRARSAKLRTAQRR